MANFSGIQKTVGRLIKKGMSMDAGKELLKLGKDYKTIEKKLGRSLTKSERIAIEAIRGQEKIGDLIGKKAIEEFKKAYGKTPEQAQKGFEHRMNTRMVKAYEREVIKSEDKARAAISNSASEGTKKVTQEESKNVGKRTSREYADKVLHHGKNALKSSISFIANHPLETLLAYEFIQAQQNGIGIMKQLQYAAFGGSEDSNGHVYQINGATKGIGGFLGGYDDRSKSKDVSILNDLMGMVFTDSQEAKIKGAANGLVGGGGKLLGDVKDMAHNSANIVNTGLLAGNDKLNEISYGNSNSDDSDVSQSIDPETGRVPSLGHAFASNPVNSFEATLGTIMSLASKGMVPRLAGLAMGAYGTNNIAKSYQQSQQRAAGYNQGTTPSTADVYEQNKVKSGLSV